MTSTNEILEISENAEASYYAGSHLLLPVSKAIGLPVDQINFVACHILSLLLAAPFRYFLHPSTTSAQVRHSFELTVGFVMAAFCFGKTVVQLLILSCLSYVILSVGTAAGSGPSVAAKTHVVVFVFSMLYLCCNHVYRQIYDYGSYTLDVTGPMMLMVQKITGLAFSYYDSRRPRSQLTADQLDQIVVVKPSILEFLSYMFYFHGMMCGPPCTYADYKRFIEGTNGIKDASSGVWSSKVVSRGESPSPWRPFGLKLSYALICCIIMLFVAPHCDPLLIVDERFLNSANFLKRFFTGVLFLGMLRSRYYFAYYLSESINNLAGLGFDGVDKEGNENWDLINNVEISKVEFSLSLKELVEAWNKTSTIWLRRCVYDRLPASINLAATYVISAIWHGFYPGYYFTFGSTALFILASRKVRRNVRPMFQSSRRLSLFYDALTFTATRIVNPYCFGPFLFLTIDRAFRLSKSIYFAFHVGALLVLLLLPKGRSLTPLASPTDTSPKNNNNKTSLSVNHVNGVVTKEKRS